ncbi:futalosine hydrolase [Streptomyces sp. NBC_00264]|uniref:futalosine hydrolase n=1 Tax=unclassified Streptomyces TaxID=2593676 RepID=UPI000F5C1C29|nr:MULTISPECIES: futalosine hydrolase [unclassified Streptomyces]WSG52497.1 futalosine hydrolase [Streptomyces sp. NBC_01732]WSX03135.1 futalosine hydrolase [Streptomyces sp. NBC_00987]MCX5102434.1 futalosine hydrolase [Streptomyces sp. NBC_00439]MCX5162024.1 futalosine hydrolase [Streptomyces sp. NBC_00305]MCX5220541.1 futalosine hydrolase [Streptomyces sp. NBC_00264]
MRVLVVTAVPAERDAVTRAFGAVPEARVHHVLGAELHRAGPFDVLAGGAGPAASAASAAFALASDRGYGLVISAGIGGGFAGVAPVGSLVVAARIGAADLGAETATGFVPVTELGFGRTWHLPPRSLVREVAAATGALTGDILTVSTVTGSADRAAALLAAHPAAAAEAMEGFGVAEAADRIGVPALEIRAVSNAVGPRDRDAWRIGDALAALTEAFGKLVPVLEGWTHHDRHDS